MEFARITAGHEGSSDSKRGGMLRARVNEYGVDKVLEAIEKVRSSDFLKGQSKSGFIITFEWFVRPNNFPKVLEGNYDNRAEPVPQKKSSKYTTAAEYQAPKPASTVEDLYKLIDKI